MNTYKKFYLIALGMVRCGLSLLEKGADTDVLRPLPRTRPSVQRAESSLGDCAIFTTSCNGELMLCAWPNRIPPVSRAQTMSSAQEPRLRLKTNTKAFWKLLAEQAADKAKVSPQQWSATPNSSLRALNTRCV